MCLCDFVNVSRYACIFIAIQKRRLAIRILLKYKCKTVVNIEGLGYIYLFIQIFTCLPSNVKWKTFRHFPSKEYKRKWLAGGMPVNKKVKVEKSVCLGINLSVFFTIDKNRWQPVAPVNEAIFDGKFLFLLLFSTSCRAVCVCVLCVLRLTSRAYTDELFKR